MPLIPHAYVLDLEDSVRVGTHTPVEFAHPSTELRGFLPHLELRDPTANERVLHADALARLHAAGLLTSHGPELATGTPASMRIHDGGAVGLCVAAMYAEDGWAVACADDSPVRHTDPYGVTSARARREAWARAVREWVPDARIAPATESATLEVLCGSGVVPLEAYWDVLARDAHHVVIVAHERGLDVSTRIQPGATPCWRCRWLHRRDADPAWVHAAAQLLGRPRSLGVQGVTTAMRIAELTYRPDSEPGTWTVTPHAQTTWAPATFHAECGCTHSELSPNAG